MLKPAGLHDVDMARTVALVLLALVALQKLGRRADAPHGFNLSKSRVSCVRAPLHSGLTSILRIFYRVLDIVLGFLGGLTGVLRCFV